MKLAVLVPRREDGGRRDQLWAYVRTRWTDLGITPTEGHHTDGPFNRSAAINQASQSAGDWDVAIIADSDSFVADVVLPIAVGQAVWTNKIVLAYEKWAGLSDAMTDQILDGYHGDWCPGVDVWLDGTCSSVIVVTRDLWETVGGFDDGFVGWGGEDVAFWRSCDTLAGTVRVPGVVWHLCHPKNPESVEETERRVAGWARLDRYGACADKPDEMRALIAELRCA